MTQSHSLAPVVFALTLAFGAAAADAATIQITSRDPAGVGFNDPDRKSVV